jgi:hypothetical protein
MQGFSGRTENSTLGEESFQMLQLQERNAEERTASHLHAFACRTHRQVA